MLVSTESLSLEVSSSITAECGKPVSLHCNISSSLAGLSIKHMQWSQSHTYCSVNSEGLVPSKKVEDFYCRYDKGHLSLHFYKWSPYVSDSSYMCKLRSNQGIKSKYTKVETKEQADSVVSVWDPSPACTFRKVCPAAEVEWFQNSQRITDQSLITTETSVEAGSWFTIRSYLNMRDRSNVYNCTLKSSSSGRYLSSAVIRPPSSSSRLVKDRAAGLGPVWTTLWTFVGLVFILGFV